jgi:polyisoprenoid-binding protein YceI
MSTTTTATTATQETGLPLGTWQIDPVHSSLEFQVRNMGLVTVKGFFADFEGSLEVDEDGQARAAGTVQAASVHTRSEKRDEHLRAPDFFDVEQHPEMTLRSTGVTETAGGYALAADLTIAGQTHPVVFALEFDGVGTDPFGNTKAGFSAATEINRSDWGLNFNMALETGGVVVSDKIKIELDIQLVRS